MPGKKAKKKRQRYMLRINDTLVEVTREVYLAWYQAGRKERYQVEKMQRHGVCSMEELQEKGYDCSFFGSITGRNRYQTVRNTGTGRSSGIFD
mgnify:CR=1 FL=1